MSSTDHIYIRKRLQRLIRPDDRHLQMLRDLEKKNYYEVLGINPDAPRDEIARVYRDLARIFDPKSDFYSDITNDQANEDHERTFRIITKAYNTLIDDNQRARYNDWLFLEQHPSLQESINRDKTPYPAIGLDSDDDEDRFARAYVNKPPTLHQRTRGRHASEAWAESLPTVSQMLRRTSGSNPWKALAYAFLGAIFGGTVGGLAYLLLTLR